MRGPQGAAATLRATLAQSLPRWRPPSPLYLCCCSCASLVRLRASISLLLPLPASAAAWDSSVPTCVNTTTGPSCTLNPVGPANYSGNYYTARYNFYVPDAWERNDTYFSWR